MAVRGAAIHSRCGCRLPDRGRGGVLRARYKDEPLLDGRLYAVRLALPSNFHPSFAFARSNIPTKQINLCCKRRGPAMTHPRPARGERSMINPDIFHRDFTPIPFWWEAYRPSADKLVELPREARVAIVGGGYAGLSAALELARHGIDAVVLEANDLGFGASSATAVRSAAASM